MVRSESLFSALTNTSCHSGNLTSLAAFIVAFKSSFGDMAAKLATLSCGKKQQRLSTWMPNPETVSATCCTDAVCR